MTNRAGTRLTPEQIRISKMWDIFGEKYPKFCVIGNYRYRPEGIFTSNEEDRLSADYVEAKAFYEELSSLDEDDLQSRWRAFVDEEPARKRKQAELNEAKHWHNRPAALANEAVYDFYQKAAYWTLDEAVALILERNPTEFNSTKLKRVSPPSQAAKKFADIRLLATRALKMNQLAPENLPGFFLAWAKRNRIDVPIALEEAVTNHGSQVADWKTLFDNQSSELARLKSELAELEAKNAAKPAASSEKPLGARERSTLLKIVLGMAMACYEHNPHAGRTTTASAILTDLQTLGIAVSDDTIRKYLAEAVEYAPPADMD